MLGFKTWDVEFGSMPLSGPNREVVLWGIGHTNALVALKWRLNPIPGARLTCVANSPISTYSGMLPGVLAGQYPPETMEIDLARLCAMAGARLILGETTGFDVEQRRLLFEDGRSIAFDALSIGIGSVPSQAGVEVLGDSLLAIKPMGTFLDRLRKRLLDQKEGGRPIRVVVVGGGTGGAEISLCLPPFVRHTLGDVPLDLSLIHAGDQLAAGSLARTNELVRERLDSRGVRLVLGCGVTRVEPERVTLADGSHIKADIVVWATGAVAPPVLGALGLPVDERGFLLTDSTLRTLADAPIFAVGDSGTIQESPTPKAGVYAVRQAPVLWNNIAHTLDGRPLETYRPQRKFLSLINTGDGRAIGEYRGLTFEGRWCWRIKDWIDRRFMGQFSVPESAG